MSENKKKRVNISSEERTAEEAHHILQLSREIDQILEHKAEAHNLTAINVKSILTHLIKNDDVLNMLRGSIKRHYDNESAPGTSRNADFVDDFNLRLTRQKKLELVQSGVPLPPVLQTPSKNFDPQQTPCCSKASKLLFENFNDDEEENNAIDDDEDYNPATQDEVSDDDQDQQNSQETEFDLDQNANLAKQIPYETRSRKSYDNVALEELEATLYTIQPDFDVNLAQVHGREPEYLDFLSSTVATGPVLAAHINDPDEDDTVDDPEYNFLEENEPVDEEELQINKATKITKKELNELFDDYLFGMFANDSEKYMPFGIPYGDETAGQSTGRSRNGMVEEMEAGFDDLDKDCPIEAAPNDVETVEDGQKQLTALVYGDKETDFSAPLLVEPTFLPLVNNYERKILEEQLRKHVQLLTQTFILSRIDFTLTQTGDVVENLLEELASKQGNSILSEKSIFNIWNLQGAMSLVNLTLRETSKIRQWDLKTLRVDARKRIAKLVAHSTGCFLYPNLLFRTIHVGHPHLQRKRLMRASETMLLTLAYLQFCEEADISINVFNLVHKYCMPARKSTALKHCAANAAKSPPGPLRSALSRKLYPSFSREVLPFDADCVLNPIDWLYTEQPIWLSKYLESIRPTVFQCDQVTNKPQPVMKGVMYDEEGRAFLVSCQRDQPIKFGIPPPPDETWNGRQDGQKFYKPQKELSSNQKPRRVKRTKIALIKDATKTTSTNCDDNQLNSDATLFEEEKTVARTIEHRLDIMEYQQSPCTKTCDTKICEDKSSEHTPEHRIRKPKTFWSPSKFAVPSTSPKIQKKLRNSPLIKRAMSLTDNNQSAITPPKKEVSKTTSSSPTRSANKVSQNEQKIEIFLSPSEEDYADFVPDIQPIEKSPSPERCRFQSDNHKMETESKRDVLKRAKNSKNQLLLETMLNMTPDLCDIMNQTLVKTFCKALREGMFMHQSQLENILAKISNWNDAPSIKEFDELHEILSNLPSSSSVNFLIELLHPLLNITEEKSEHSSYNAELRENYLLAASTICRSRMFAAEAKRKNSFRTLQQTIKDDFQNLSSGDPQNFLNLVHETFPTSDCRILINEMAMLCGDVKIDSWSDSFEHIENFEQQDPSEQFEFVQFEPVTDNDVQKLSTTITGPKIACPCCCHNMVSSSSLVQNTNHCDKCRFIFRNGKLFVRQAGKLLPAEFHYESDKESLSTIIDKTPDKVEMESVISINANDQSSVALTESIEPYLNIVDMLENQNKDDLPETTSHRILSPNVQDHNYTSSCSNDLLQKVMLEAFGSSSFSNVGEGSKSAEKPGQLNFTREDDFSNKAFQSEEEPSVWSEELDRQLLEEFAKNDGIVEQASLKAAHRMNLEIGQVKKRIGFLLEMLESCSET